MIDLMDIGSRLFLGRKVIMLGVFRSGTATETVQALWVNKVKADIQHEKLGIYASLDHFAKDHADNYADTPVVLCIDSEHLIFESDSDAVSVFDSKDFLIEDSDDYKLHAVVRKSQVESYLTELAACRKSIVKLCLGPVQALNWTADLNLEQPYYLGSNEVHIIDNIVQTKVSTEAQSTPLDNESFSPAQLLLFLTSFSFFLQPDSSPVQEVNKNAREHLFSNVFKKVMVIGGSIVFAVMLLSTSLFFYYEAENVQLNERYYEQNIIRTKVDKYRSDIARLENILDSENRNPVFSRLANDIALGLPVSISLKEMTIFPVDLTVMKRKKSIKSVNQIVIVGQSHTMSEVADWVSGIKDLNWVEDISKNEIDKVEAGFLIKMTISVANVE